MIFVILISWILLGILMVYKQNECEKEHTKTGLEWGPVLFVFIIAPIWLIGAIIRQLFTETWK